MLCNSLAGFPPLSGMENRVEPEYDSLGIIADYQSFSPCLAECCFKLLSWLSLFFYTYFYMIGAYSREQRIKRIGRSGK